jgi:hypothetical protein
MTIRLPALTVSLAALLAAAHLAARAAPHQHGVGAMDVALDGAALTVTLRLPLDTLVGYERAPRTAAERAAADAVLLQLRDASTLLVPDAAAGCRAQPPAIDAGPLAPGAQPVRGEHADLEATYTFTCAQSAQLRAIALPIFETLPRLQRVDVQVAGPQGQRKATLRRSAARSLRLAP